MKRLVIATLVMGALQPHASTQTPAASESSQQASTSPINSGQTLAGRRAQIEAVYGNLLKEISSRSGNENMRDLQKRYGEANTASAEMKLQTLALALLDLAASDKDAKELVAKWNIRRNPTPP